MDSASVARIERELGVELPRAYANLLLNYPESLTRHEFVREFLLCDTADRVIALNRLMEGLEFWPNHLLAIGETGSGDVFVVDVGDDNPPVDLWTPTTRSIDTSMRADSLEQFAGGILQEFDAHDV